VKRSLALVLLAALALGGCAAQGKESGTAASSTPTKAPVEMTKPEAKAAYLKLASSSKPMYDKFTAAGQAGDFKKVRTLIPGVVAADEKFADALSTPQWPDAIEGDLGIVATEIGKTDKWLEGAVPTTTDAEMTAYLGKYDKSSIDKSAAAGNRIAKYLGIATS
jgi:hypothetical protein